MTSDNQLSYPPSRAYAVTLRWEVAVNTGDIAQLLLAAGGVAGVTGGIAAAVQSRATKRRLDAEAAKLDADSKNLLTQRANTVNTMALGLLEPMETRIRQLTDEVDHLRRQVHALTDRLTLAQRLLDQHGISLPSWPESPA